MKRQAEALIPTPWGEFTMMAFSEDVNESMPHVAMVHHRINLAEPVLVRIHSECLTGDLFGSLRCDCGDQLIRSMELAAEKGGVVIYLRQEGRGIGLINKLKAYTLQDQGMNTLEANRHLGLAIDGRRYGEAIEIMENLGITAVHLLTNNPLKLEAVERSSIRVVSRAPIIIPPKEENWKYLKAKQELMGHFL